MKKFILKLILISTLVLVIDRICFKILQSFRPSDYKYFLESKQAFFETDESIDILIIGDSHIADALDPKIVENKTGMTCFNMGVYHSSPLEQYHLLKSCLDHLERKPKYLIIGTNPVMFTRPMSPGKYTPIIINSMQKNFDLYADGEGVDFTYFFKTAQERHLFKSFKNSILGKEYKPTRIVKEVYKGYLKTNNQIPGLDFQHFDPIKELDISFYQLEYFEYCIRLAQKNDIKLVMVHPPIWEKKMQKYRASDLYKEFQKQCREFEKKYELPVFNPDRNQFVEILEPKDFLNPEHLNGFGANKFSLSFSKWLNELE